MYGIHSTANSKNKFKNLNFTLFVKMTFLLLLICHECKSQSQNDEATAFGGVPNEYSGSARPNLYDGTVSVSAPFFSTTVDGVPISVSCAYNTKGIRVDQISSPAGLGWELTSGPVITREVADYPDELYIPPYTRYAIGPNASYGPTGPAHDGYSGMWYNMYIPRTEYYVETIDDELDRFSLYLGSGKIDFYISRGGEVFTVPQSNIKIERIINGVPVGNSVMAVPASGCAQAVLTFIVTDESGNKYYFEQGEKKRQQFQAIKGVDMARMNGYWDNICLDATYRHYNGNNGMPEGYFYYENNKWVIDKIVTRFGNETNFSYNYTTPSYKVARVVNAEEDPNNMVAINYSYRDVLFKGMVATLSSISLPDKTLVLLSYVNDRCDVSGAPRLSAIKISRHYNEYSTQNFYKNELNYKFYHSYFVSNSAGAYNTATLAAGCASGNSAEAMRLKLDKITKSGEDFNEHDYYDFEYVNQGMPPRTSYSQDLYGYYNGQAVIPCTLGGSPQEIPVSYHTPVDEFGNAYGVSRTVNPTLMRAYALNKITNEFGGTTEFEFGHNSGLSAVHFGNQYGVHTEYKNQGDGLRVNRIVTKSGIGQPTTDRITEISYPEGEMFLPGSVSRYTQNYNSVLMACSGSTSSKEVFLNNALSLSLPVNGSNHGYIQVDVTSKNGSGDILGKTKYTYSGVGYGTTTSVIDAQNMQTPSNINYDNKLTRPSGSLAYDEYPFTNKQYLRTWGMGLPLIIERLDGNGKILEQVFNKYELTTVSTGNTDFISKKSMPWIMCGSRITGYKDDTYTPVTGYSKLVKTTTKSYISDNLINSRDVNYTYDSYNNIKNVTSYTSSGESVTETRYYNYDWPLNSSSSNSAINALNQLNVKVPVYSETIKDNAILLSSSPIGYGLVGGYVRRVHSYASQATNGAVATAGTPNFNMASAGNGNPVTGFRRISSNTVFDSHGNVCEVRTPEGGISSFIYNGPYGQLVASTANAAFAETAYCGFEGGYIFGSSDGTGNLNFDPTNIVRFSTKLKPTFPNMLVTQKALNGNLGYQLKGGNIIGSRITSTTTLVGGKHYLLSFWILGTQVPSVKAGGVSVMPTHVKSAMDWHLYEADFTSNGGGIEIASDGNDIFIDEIRLHPFGALMNTTSYEPLFGVKSTCDANNNIKLYEYDYLGNLVLVMDEKGRILKKNITVIQGND